MSTDQTSESKPEAASGVLPTPTFEEPSAVSSPSTVDIEAIVEKVAAKMMPSVEKMVQSQKDKRLAKMEKQLEAAGLSELEEMGVQIPENVKLEYRLRNLEAQKSTPVQDVPKAKDTTQDIEQVSSVLKEANLDANTPEVLSLLGGKYRNMDHFKAEALSLKLRLDNRPTPDASVAPAQTGGNAGPQKDEKAKHDALVAQVNQWQLNPSVHKAELDNAYKELGWS